MLAIIPPRKYILSYILACLLINISDRNTGLPAIVVSAGYRIPDADQDRKIRGDNLPIEPDLVPAAPHLQRSIDHTVRIDWLLGTETAGKFQRIMVHIHFHFDHLVHVACVSAFLLYGCLLVLPVDHTRSVPCH